MVHKATSIGVLRGLAFSLIASFVVLVVVLRVETYRFQRKAERLMEDFQSINLRHSSWPDAERLIRRWGNYGSYQGDCTGAFCRYSIALESPERRLEDRAVKYLNHRFVEAAATSFFAACQHLGGRSATLRASIVVQDDVVVRKGAAFEYSVPLAFSRSSGYSLIATSHAASRLTTDGWPSVSSEQLAEHPFYVFTRPGGCSFCLMVNVTFTPDTPEPELRWLTTFNLGCLTSFRQCRYLEDIYSASEEWHLYDGTFGGRPEPADRTMRQESASPLACRVPIFARGREADQIFSVTSITDAQERQPGEVTEKARVRLESILKGSTRYKTGEIFSVTSRSYAPYIPVPDRILLTPGAHFLLLSVRPEDNSQTLELERCLVLPDTPEARAQIVQGIVQNDILRYPDPRSSNFIPE